MRFLIKDDDVLATSAGLLQLRQMRFECKRDYFAYAICGLYGEN